MSVLVRGMEMPKECRECPLETYYMNSGMTRCRVGNTILAENFKTIPFDGRPDFCPLVDVHPHGDLIDIESKITIGIKDGLKVTTVRNLLNDKAVRLPKTVIEAESGEKA